MTGFMTGFMRFLRIMDPFLRIMDPFLRIMDLFY